MLRALVLFSAGLLCLPLRGNAAANVDGNCTDLTPNDFQVKYIQNCKKYFSSEGTCNSAYTAFLGAFANESSSNVQQEDYSSYYDVLPIIVGVNQSLFWSGTFSLVQILSMMNAMGVDIVSSENTPSSRIINDFGDPNLCWCSAPGLSGLLLDSICPKAVRSLFWAQFSLEFAQVARGNVFYLTDGARMTDGERKPAYSPSSFFGCIELVNLNTSVVDRLVVLNIHREKEGEACGEGSLITLRQNATSRGLSYTCYDLYGQANDTTQAAALTTCARMVIDNVQKGSENEDRQIKCSSGKKNWNVSLVILFVALLVSSGVMM